MQRRFLFSAGIVRDRKVQPDGISLSAKRLQIFATHYHRLFHATDVHLMQLNLFINLFVLSLLNLFIIL